MMNENSCVFDRGGFCAALVTKECVNCHFAKTKDELEDGRRKAKARVRSLPRNKYHYIKVTYKQKYEVK